MPSSKTVIEDHEIYLNHEDGPVTVHFYPNGKAFRYKIDKEKKIGVTTVTNIIEKEAIAFWKLREMGRALKRKFQPMKDGNFVYPQTLDELDDWVFEATSASDIIAERSRNYGTTIHEWLATYLEARRDGTELPVIPERKDMPDPEAEKYQQDPWSYEDDMELVAQWNHLIDALEDFHEWWGEHDIEVVETERIIYSKTYDYCGTLDAVLRIDGKLYLVDFKTNNPSRDYPKGVFPEVFCQIGGYDVAYTEEHAPEAHKKQESMFDGHLCLNFSKKTGKFNKEYNFDTKINRSWFLYTLGTKKGHQHTVRQLSMMYRENRPKKGSTI